MNVNFLNFRVNNINNKKKNNNVSNCVFKGGPDTFVKQTNPILEKLSINTGDLYKRVMKDASEEAKKVIENVFKYIFKHNSKTFDKETEQILFALEDENDNSYLKNMSSVYNLHKENTPSNQEFIYYWTLKSIMGTDKQEQADEISKELECISMFDKSLEDKEKMATTISEAAHIGTSEDLDRCLQNQYYRKSDDFRNKFIRSLFGDVNIEDIDANSTTDDVAYAIKNTLGLSNEDLSEVKDAFEKFEPCFYFLHMEQEIPTPVPTNKNTFIKNLLSKKTKQGTNILTKNTLIRFLEVVSCTYKSAPDNVWKKIMLSINNKKPEEYEQIILKVLDDYENQPGFKERKEINRSKIHLFDINERTGKIFRIQDVQEILKESNRFNEDDKKEIQEKLNEISFQHPSILVKLLVADINNEYVFSKDSILFYLNATKNFSSDTPHNTLLNIIMKSLKDNNGTDKEILLKDIIEKNTPETKNENLPKGINRVFLETLGIVDIERDINKQDAKGNIPILQLIKNSKCPMLHFQYLLNQPNINPNIPNNDGEILLLEAFDNIDTFNAVVQSPKIDINNTDKNKSSIWDKLIKNYQNYNRDPFIYRLNEILKRKDLDINIKNNLGETPLNTICRLKDLHKYNGYNLYIMTRKLLNRPDIDLNTRNNNGNTPIIEALTPVSVYCPKQKLTPNEYMSIYGELTTEKYKNVLELLNLNIVNYLDAEEIKKKIRTQEGRDALLMLKEQLENESANNGSTNVEKTNNLQIVKNLCKLAFEGCRNKLGTGINIQLIKAILAKKGVDLSITDEKGNNKALQLANEYMPEIVPLLEEYMEKGYCESLKNYEFTEY